MRGELNLLNIAVGRNSLLTWLITLGVIKMAYIYQIVNDINDKIYVGKTYRNINTRFQEHCSDCIRYKGKNRPLYNAMRKYGIEHFWIELLEETNNPEEREKYWIKEKNSYKYGYNATQGGDGIELYDHEAIIARLKDHPYPCDIAKEFGCSRDIIYDLGKENDIILLNKSREQMKERLSKKVSAYTKQGSFVKNFSSATEAGKWCVEQNKSSSINSGKNNISECANGKRKTAFGYIWKWDIFSELS